MKRLGDDLRRWNLEHPFLGAGFTAVWFTLILGAFFVHLPWAIVSGLIFFVAIALLNLQRRNQR